MDHRELFLFHGRDDHGKKAVEQLINVYLEKMELYFKSKGILGHSVELKLLTSAMTQLEGQCTSQNLEADKQEQHILIKSDTPGTGKQAGVNTARALERPQLVV